MYKQYIKNPSSANKDKYTRYRNKLTHIISKSKSKYYSDLVTAFQGDSKKTWRVLNNILNRDQNTKVFPEIDHSDTHPHTTRAASINASLADKFNDYFVSIGQNLSCKIVQPQNTSFEQYLSGSYPNSLFLKPTDNNEVCKIVKNIKNSNSAAADEISNKIVKTIIDVIVDPLVFLY